MNDFIYFFKFLWALILYANEWLVFLFRYGREWVVYLFKRAQDEIRITFGGLNILEILWNLAMIAAAELLYLADAVVAVVYLIFITIGYKIAILFPLLYIYDKSMEFFRAKAGMDPLHPHALTLLDRGLACSAAIWPLAEIFMFCQESARQYRFSDYLNHEYFRGLVVLFSAAPPTTILISFLVYNQIVRRIGHDTRWFGARPIVGVKYLIRYHWCFALCQHTIITLWIFCFLKFAVANGLRGDDQEVWITSFFFMNLGLSAYQMLCAIIGVKCRFPIFHRACIFNCGRQKGSKDGSDPLFPEAPEKD